ncbi:MAG: ABC transporter ATP-binding protein [Clostridiales bacterium]|jgi:ABC-2 type transport system ATP-binding protein|nr:ABC transporter ATP-binding protein [Clostridiales bacterium]
MVSIRNITKIYAKQTVKAVDNLSLEIGGGIIFGFLGPNGAGKTTTLKMLTGILPFTIGEILIDGVDIRRNPIEAKRKIGFVPDNHAVYDKLTGRQYINFMSDIYNVPALERKERADALLERLHLAKDADAQISSYSHGMKQKICVIGALIHNPSLWVLDEPLTGLDPQSSFELKQMMREHADAGNTVLFSTHVLEVAEKICDRVGIIDKGILVGAGSLAEIGGSLERFFLDKTTDAAEAAASPKATVS